MPSWFSNCSKKKEAPPEQPSSDFRRKVASRPLDLQSISSISSIASSVLEVRNISVPQKLLSKAIDFEYSADGSLEYEKGRRFLHGQHEVLMVGGKDGMDARQSARYYFQRAAEAGHAVGTAMYGMCCELGIGGDTDYKLAAKLYTIALRRGSSMGHCLLASLGDRTPLGTAISGSESRKWKASCPSAVSAVEGLYSLYEASETFQVLEAMYLMGHLSETGCGMAQDWERAAQYYRSAAAEEFPPACTALGYCYEKGNGVEVDLDEAQHWYEIAARRGDTRGMVCLAKMLEGGERESFPIHTMHLVGAGGQLKWSPPRDGMPWGAAMTLPLERDFRGTRQRRCLRLQPTRVTQRHNSL